MAVEVIEAQRKLEQHFIALLYVRIYTAIANYYIAIEVKAEISVDKQKVHKAIIHSFSSSSRGIEQ